jgi:hypothetical protein
MHGPKTSQHAGGHAHIIASYTTSFAYVIYSAAAVNSKFCSCRSQIFLPSHFDRAASTYWVVLSEKLAKPKVDSTCLLNRRSRIRIHVQAVVAATVYV